MTTDMYPALIPWRTRPTTRATNEPPDRQTTGIAARNSAADATIIRLRPNRSASIPAVSDATMPPKRTAPTTTLSSPSENSPSARMYGIAAAIVPKSMP